MPLMSGELGELVLPQDGSQRTHTWSEKLTGLVESSGERPYTLGIMLRASRIRHHYKLIHYRKKTY